MKHLVFFVLVHWIFAGPQINLLYTDWMSGDVSDPIVQHDCLRLIASIEMAPNHQQIIWYCMSESPGKFDVESKNSFPRYTFDELSQANITSEDLYAWSTPMDIIERYQFYLISDDLALSTKVFYNCTWPRFGPMCQYELFDYPANRSSLYELVRDFYNSHPYKPMNLTCYTHLNCSSLCLDWGEICDGKLDCFDNGFDEKDCWQLEFNECQDDEYRCYNGQCIPRSFYRDGPNVSDCFDGSDEINVNREKVCQKHNQPSIACEDVKCGRVSHTLPCMEQRMRLVLKAIYSVKDSSVSNECWSAFKCLVKAPDSGYPSCQNLCKPNTCIEIAEKTCPEILLFPSIPVLFGDVYLGYPKNEMQVLIRSPSRYFYICYNNSHYDDFFNRGGKITFKNLTCTSYEGYFLQFNRISIPAADLYLTYYDFVYELYQILRRYHLLFNYTSELCNRSNAYQCVGSLKCISIYHLNDGISDCPSQDDEDHRVMTNPNLIKRLDQNYYKCHLSNRYIHQNSVRNAVCDCQVNDNDGEIWCEDEDEDLTYIRKNIFFPTICDGYVELLMMDIDGRNETDETACEQWPCHNIYTHCDQTWNCPDGTDENNCYSTSTLNCSSDTNLCVSSTNNQLICLPVERYNDGEIDCLGAADESIMCKDQSSVNPDLTFYCRNGTSERCLIKTRLCDGKTQCENGDDEQACTTETASRKGSGICLVQNYHLASDVEKLLCDHFVRSVKQPLGYFKLDENRSINMKKSTSTDLPEVKIPIARTPSHCNRGLDLRVWLKNNRTTMSCLCPPSYYGSQCQYQNQRISLSIQFRALSDSWRTPFAIVFLLIDDSDTPIIHSYEQISFLSLRDCEIKYNMNLLHSTRPKDLARNYSVHIHIYEKATLIHRGSVLLPVVFPFLPVQHLAHIVDIPRNNDTTQICSNDRCVHGKCIRYSNHPNQLTFCQCEQGWSGRYCTIPRVCQCSSDSLCIGISANHRSICVCPLNKFGSRCLLTNTVCQGSNNSFCENGGQCIPNDNYMISDQQRFVCICPKEFTGDRCQFTDNKLLLSFEKTIVLSQSIFIHFLEIRPNIISNTKLDRSTTFRTLSIQQNPVMIYWSQPFHLAFVEISNKTYYLAVVQNTYNRSTTINRLLTPNDRCPNIDELFNKTFAQWHLIRRIKSYHLPCQNRSLNLSCFYDDVHLCLCYNFGVNRLANCFRFDHQMTFNCFGRSECENGGQCFQDTPNCPTRSLCICPECFYGRRCQFSTRGFGLSLDGILGYHILPTVSLFHQPVIVQMSFALTIIFTIAGLINGILSLITFKNKCVREVGCGLYLLGSSITTLLTTVMFGMKFWILVLTQMSTISNRTFLWAQCYSLDFLLRSCLCMDQWLNACVAVERAITAVKGAQFEKKKSKQAAKFVICLLLIIVVGSGIHDPISRRLIDEVNDDDNIKRVWCIVRYSSGVEIYNSIAHVLHFSVPFLMNFISTIVLIVKQTHQQASVHSNRTYQEHLREQIEQYKHLLTGPIVLVILALPRIILSFVSKCMKSAGDSWLFLLGYFISFIPPMLTFVVFILPSKFYKKELRQSIVQYRKLLQRRLHLITDG